MRYIIHAGPRKTGTTSIQKCLDIHRELLLAHGVYYPKLIQNVNAHHQIPSALSGSLEAIEAQSNQDFSDFDLCKHLNEIYNTAESLKCNTILLSSEAFSGLTISNFVSFCEMILLTPDDSIEILWVDRDLSSSVNSFIWQGINIGDHWDEKDRPNLEKLILSESVFPEMLMKEFERNENVKIHIIPYAMDSSSSYLYKLYRHFLPNEVAIELEYITESLQLNKSGTSSTRTLINEFNLHNVKRDWAFLGGKVVNTDDYPSEKKRLSMFQQAAYEIQFLTEENSILKARNQEIVSSQTWHYVSRLFSLLVFIKRFLKLKKRQS